MIAILDGTESHWEVQELLHHLNLSSPKIIDKYDQCHFSALAWIQTKMSSDNVFHPGPFAPVHQLPP